MAQWGDLPQGVLGIIAEAGGVAAMVSMRRVCKNWQGGYEGAVRHIAAQTAVPLPLAAILIERFPSLRSLNLVNCSWLTDMLFIECFSGVPLASLTLDPCHCKKLSLASPVVQECLLMMSTLTSLSLGYRSYLA